MEIWRPAGDVGLCAAGAVQLAFWQRDGYVLALARDRSWFTLDAQVHLCGSFTRWVETVPMAAVEGNPGIFAVVVHLPPG
jgi:hypothetical protein